jgi:serine/tyrosine/threonine adenylyltransferase
MAAPLSSSAAAPSGGKSINDIPKTWNFTSKLPADSIFATPADSHKTPRDEIGPREVRNATYTWVRPETVKDPELLAVSPAALRDLGIDPADPTTNPDFLATLAGNKIQGWDEETQSGPGYPWAQLYGGFQFGQWAGQLGDGRAISLFETTPEGNSSSSSSSSADEQTRRPKRYELQLKGAGLTPYSRFADGKAVLRSSIREFVVSEALHALGIPSTRALSLVLTPGVRVRRESLEPGAIVCRFAPTWLRIGSFDILRARGDRPLIRRLATYVAEDVYAGWDALPGRLDYPDAQDDGDAKKSGSSAAVAGAEAEPARGVGKDDIQGPAGAEENRFARLFREIVRRNASTVAKWQAYGFMNGVLNTDNTSLLGLSIDFGPFAFMDNFDPAYTPNHDDYLLRYSYRNQPSIIWWNLVRLGEALGELIGAGSKVDDAKFVEDGVQEADSEELIARAEKIIMRTGEEYKAVFLAEYKRLMAARLGLKRLADSDFDDLFSPLLDTMEALELDFNLFFRRLSSLKVAHLDTQESREVKAGVFFYKDGTTGTAPSEDEGRRRVGEWLDKWRARITEDWGASESADEQRRAAMKAINPSFIPRGWVLDELIHRVEKDGERDVLGRVMRMVTHPFEDGWDGRTLEGEAEPWKGDAEEEVRWTTEVPKVQRAMQCSCSS